MFPILFVFTSRMFNPDAVLYVTLKERELADVAKILFKNMFDYKILLFDAKICSALPPKHSGSSPKMQDHLRTHKLYIYIL